MDAKENLNHLHENYVVVPADKASNNIIFVCKQYYIHCLQNELGLLDNVGNPTYALSTISKDEILANHQSVWLELFGITNYESSADLPSLYWIPKLHQCPYKQRLLVLRNVQQNRFPSS